jgi:hypothetical protein
MFSNETNITLQEHQQIELLANEIPSLTFAAGHRGIDDPSFYQKNFELREKYLEKMNARWPRMMSNNEPEWRHNDASFMAYPYLYRLYLDWVKLTKGEPLE